MLVGSEKFVFYSFNHWAGEFWLNKQGMDLFSRRLCTYPFKWKLVRFSRYKNHAITKCNLAFPSPSTDELQDFGQTCFAGLELRKSIVPKVSCKVIQLLDSWH